MAGSKQIRVGRIERIANEWERHAEILEEINSIGNIATEAQVRIIRKMVSQLRETIGICGDEDDDV